MTGVQRELLDRLFCAIPEPQARIRMHRLEALFELGKAARDGCIVELGTYHGAGATALGMGTQAGNACDVYTVDDYNSHRVGVKGDRYGAADYNVMVANILASGASFHHVWESAQTAAGEWLTPVSLLYWDLPEQTLVQDFMAWQKHLTPTATFAVHDHDNTFGAQEFIKHLVGTGAWKRGPDFPLGGIYTVTGAA